MCLSGKVSNAAKRDGGGLAEAKPLVERRESKALEDVDRKLCVFLRLQRFRRAAIAGPISHEQNKRGYELEGKLEGTETFEVTEPFTE